MDTLLLWVWFRGEEVVSLKGPVLKIPQIYRASLHKGGRIRAWSDQFQKQDKGLIRRLPGSWCLVVALDDGKSITLASTCTFLDGDIVIEYLKMTLVVSKIKLGMRKN